MMLEKKLESNWGTFDCPPDLTALWDAAPKDMVTFENEDGEAECRNIPDISTAAGSAYYAREREILRAIDVIFSTGTMDVVNTKER